MANDLFNDIGAKQTKAGADDHFRFAPLSEIQDCAPSPHKRTFDRGPNGTVLAEILDFH
jgi:hypothetical protein